MTNQFISIYFGIIGIAQIALIGMSVGAPIISLAIFYICSRLITQHFALKNDSIRPYLFMLLTPVLLLWSLEFYILHKAYGNIVTIPYPIEPTKHFELFLLQILGFGTILSCLYACGRLWESFDAKARLSLLEQEVHAQKTYVLEAKMRYRQTAAFRHDIKDHLTVLEGFLQKEQMQQAETYLLKLVSVTDNLSFPVHSGNAVIDILLSSKLELAVQHGIRTECFFVLPKTCSIDDFDLCVIFSNALDNAILACLQADNAPEIHITGDRQGDLYLLGFKNTCSLKPNSKIIFGTGLQNIEATAKKYGGGIQIEQLGNFFCLDVLLNIS